jgi:hypothetical protein
MAEDFPAQGCPECPGFGPSAVSAEVALRQEVTVRYLVRLPEAATESAVTSLDDYHIHSLRCSSFRTERCEESER